MIWAAVKIFTSINATKSSAVRKSHGPAALLQVALETKQPRKKETQSRKDWIGIEEAAKPRAAH